MDLNAIIEPLREAVATAAGVEYIAEAGNDVALPDQPKSRFAAMRLESLPVTLHDHDYAVLDRVMDMSVTFAVGVRVDSSGQTEAMARLRGVLCDMAEAALDSKAWGAGVPYGLMVQGGEYGMGAADEYGQYFQARAAGWVAGHFTVTLQVIC